MPYKDRAKLYAYQREWRLKKKKERLKKEKLVAESLFHTLEFANPTSQNEIGKLFELVFDRPLTLEEYMYTIYLWRAFGKKVLTALAIVWKERSWKELTIKDVEEILFTVVNSQEVCPECGRPFPVSMNTTV
ncbi:MAG: hypothetical protein AB1523_12330 [Bacillota bacterium]